MSKYYLKIYFENGNSEIITKGSLEQVDNFIIDNDIYNDDDLYEYCIPNLSKHFEGQISFKIEYKYNEQIKEKPLFFKATLNRFRNNHITDEIHELIMKDENFKREFFKKYFQDILSADKNVPILKYVSKYIKEPNQKTFNQFYYSYITSKKTQKTSSNNTALATKSVKKPLYIEYGEMETQITYSYSKKRNLFEFLDIYKYGNFNHHILIPKEDEFDELLFHDQNPDTGLIIPKFEENKEFVEEEKEISSVKMLRKTPKVNENQISVFDIL